MKMSPSPVEELALTDLDRSNKGASKQRRDLINAEIAVMRDLLPLSESARQRLSQLQVMSLSCVFIRKCNVLRQLFSSIPAETDMPMTCDFSQALTGFLLITTREGKLVYISENVTDYLGHSMVDMKTQGDSLYDIVDKRDAKSVQAYLTQGGAKEPDLSRDVSFFCRMNMSRTLKRQSAFGDVKVMHVKGHFLPLSDPSSSSSTDQQQQQKSASLSSQHQQKFVLMATCTPLITPELKESLIQSNTMVFKTVHRMDMTFLEVTKTAEYHLGCSAEEICQRSWYSTLHHWDVPEARKKHLMLIQASQEVGCMMTVRLLTPTGEVIWVNMVMQVRQSSAVSSSQSEDRVIVCINQVISEEEAFQIRMQSHMFALYPPQSADSWSTMLSHAPPPGQSDAVSWMHPQSSSPPTHLSPPPSLHQVLGQHHCQAIPSSYVSAVGQLSPPHPSPSSPPTAVLPPSAAGHTKLLLKRKLQAPSLPAKVRKMAWDESVRAVESRQGFERSVATSPLQFKVGNVSPPQFSTPGGYSWSGSVPGGSVAVQQVYSVGVGDHQKVQASMLPLSPPQGSLSPPLPATHQGAEQVVPQSAVMTTVPESCLTPDSSPASSPDPRTSVQGSPRGVMNSALCLTNPDTLPAFVQNKISALSKSKTDAGVKVEPGKEGCCLAVRRRELPIMDASDIESFFDTLDCANQFIAMTGPRKDTCQAPLQKISEKVPVSKAPVLVSQTPRIKQEVDVISHTPLASSQQGAAKRADPSSEQNFRELEELLSIFSGEMTATQLNLDDLLMPPAPEGEAEDRDHQENGVCGAGHSDPFLLPSLDWDRPKEGFSPVSPSESSGDEDGNSPDDFFAKLNKVIMLPKCVDGEKHGCSPLFFATTPSPVAVPSPPHQPPQAEPGIPEEDELYQLDKLLSLIASNNGVMLSQDSQ